MGAGLRRIWGLLSESPAWSVSGKTRPPESADVKWQPGRDRFNDEKGYGLRTPDDGGDAIVRTHRDQRNEDQASACRRKVTYTRDEPRQGPEGRQRRKADIGCRHGHARPVGTPSQTFRRGLHLPKEGTRSRLEGEVTRPCPTTSSAVKALRIDAGNAWSGGTSQGKSAPPTSASLTGDRREARTVG